MSIGCNQYRHQPGCGHPQATVATPPGFGRWGPRPPAQPRFEDAAIAWDTPLHPGVGRVAIYTIPAGTPLREAFDEETGEWVPTETAEHDAFWVEASDGGLNFYDDRGEAVEDALQALDDVATDAMPPSYWAEQKASLRDWETRA